jgi:L-rhamnose mutarotase
MKIKNWIACVQDRGKWKEVVEQAKKLSTRKFSAWKKKNETLFPNWQKKSWQTFEETFGYVRPERVNKWGNPMTDI